MADLYSGLDDLAKTAKDWKCKLLFNEQDDIVEDLDRVDLCNFLPYMSIRARKTNMDYPPGTNYMFPERFKGIASKGLLMVELKLAGIQCGYSLAIRSSTSTKAYTVEGTQREFQCTLKCLHSLSSLLDGWWRLVHQSQAAKRKRKLKVSDYRVIIILYSMLSTILFIEFVLKT
jgi:hypothetical protein